MEELCAELFNEYMEIYAMQFQTDKMLIKMIQMEMKSFQKTLFDTLIEVLS